MYCPKCAAENMEGVSFCRSCGADIRLVPQALTGSLPVVSTPTAGDDLINSRRNRRKGKDEGPPSMARGIEKLFTGLGFIFVALAIGRFMPGGWTWWFWMLIPAFALIGGGVSQIVQSKQQLNKVYQPPAFPPAPSQAPLFNASSTPAGDLPRPRQTGEIRQPPSVTEATTRHLKSKAEDSAKNF